MMEPERTRTRIIRLYKIEEVLISRNGVTATQLCKQFRVTRRTIYRDLELIQELGIPLYKNERGFAIMGTYKIPSYRLEIIQEKAR